MLSMGVAKKSKGLKLRRMRKVKFYHTLEFVTARGKKLSNTDTNTETRQRHSDIDNVKNIRH
jgi:hypothetical protein